MAKRKQTSRNRTKDRNARTSTNGTTAMPSRVFDLGDQQDMQALSRIMPASILNRLKTDPSAGVEDAPPNYGDAIVPQIATVIGKISPGTQVYWPNDECLRNIRANAPAMLNYPAITECLEARYRKTAMAKWHIEPEDEKDEKQKEVAAELQLMIERIGLPLQDTAGTQNGFVEYRFALMRAIWYGRYAVQNAWNWVKVKGKMRCIPTKWIPINGDKLVFRWDDGSGRYEDGQIGIRVTMGGFPAGTDQATIDQIEPADYSQALFLNPWQRQLLVVHKYMIEDGDFNDPYGAGAIHGVGIRSRIYWTWYQMVQALAWFMEYLERSAFGIELWTYPASNAIAQAETRKAATERVGGGRTCIMVPVFPGEESMQYGLKLVEPGLQGVEILREVVHGFFGHQIKRYILGQTLTSEADATGMGSELATIHLMTLSDIVQYDARKLDETLTTDLVSRMVQYNFPQYKDTYFRFVTDIDPASNDDKMEAIQKAYLMGLKIKSADLYQLTGLSKPSETDEVLGGPQQPSQILGGPQVATEHLEGGVAGESKQPEHDTPSGEDGEQGMPAKQIPSTPDPSGGIHANQRDRNSQWEESKHPRGQPENAGQFGPGGGSSSEDTHEPSQSQSSGLQDAEHGGKGKEYKITSGGKEVPEHLKKLRLPPAWTNVRINTHPEADLIATGLDAKGRKQYVYSDNHTMRQAAAKFARITELYSKANTVEGQIDVAVAGGSEEALVAKLIFRTGIRPGSDANTKAEKKAYGATTLLGQHVKPQEDGSVVLEFVGKKGVDLSIPVHDEYLANELKKRAATAGNDGPLFNTDDAALRDFVHGLDGGGFKPKDFRTLRGTSLAAELVRDDNECCKTSKEYQKRVREVATQVSQLLGNTPTIALQSYIDPTVFSKWRPAA